MSVDPTTSALVGDLSSTPQMRAVFSDEHALRCMLAVEAALARAQATLGIIPVAAAAAIDAAAHVEKIDAAAIAASAQLVGYPVVGLVKELSRVAGPDAARYVHWGATTQDILDTALVLQLRDALRFVESDVAEIARALVALARKHRGDVMAGRSMQQHALPVTFGYTCALWLAPFAGYLERLRDVRERVVMLQFGGAVGTLASLGTRGREVVEALARELGLGVPVFPWHVVRPSLVETASLVATICGSLAKMATDIALLMQTEIAEVFEPYEPGRGASSTMPQKRNPIGSVYIIAATRGVHAVMPLLYGAMVQEHERATGRWQSESLAIVKTFVLASGALAHAKHVTRGLRADPVRMRSNLALTSGLIMAEAATMALAEKTGIEAAHHAIEAACATAIEERATLGEVLKARSDVRAHFDEAAIDALLDPATYLGECEAVVERVTRATETALSAGGPDVPVASNSRYQ